MKNAPAKAAMPFEPERYELNAAPAYHFAASRREFFKLLGSGLLVVSVSPQASVAQESGSSKRPKAHELPSDIGAWLHIGEDGKVTVFTGKAEMGQNIRTSLTQAVAEELHVPIVSIEMVMGDTQLTPFDMGTFGSRTTPIMNLQLRKVAAAALTNLLEMAAAQWQVNRESLEAAEGKITHKENKRSIAYPELLKGRQLTQTVRVVETLTPPARWTAAGRSAPKIDGRDFVTGKHRYPSDQKLPGMLHGKILRQATFNATLASADTSLAEKMPGVTVVRDGDFLGVAAGDTASAGRAIAAIKAEWKSSPQLSNADFFQSLQKAAGEKQPGSEASYETGSVEKALAGAEQRLLQSYTVAYIAHAPLEPRAALAQWSGDNLTVWTGSQRPFGVRTELAEAFRIPESQVRVILPDTGSAYGGKHTGEAAIEAARLARAAKRPVKLVWTREEEFSWAYFRPGGLVQIASGMSKDGKLTAWDFHNYNSGEAGIRSYYNIPNQRCVFHEVESPLRQGSYRGLAATANHFAREVHMDELARVANMDALEFRLKNLDNERLRAVFTAGAEKFGWGKAKADGERGFGMGGGFEKLGNVATFVEVAVDRESNTVRIVRMVTAFECGAIVNPGGLRNQIEGANIMGLGGALFEAVQFENGRILNGRFSKYRLPRFTDVPPIETVMLDRKDLPPAGAGEAPIVGVAPAIGNAIFDATRVRLRSLPLLPNNMQLPSPSAA
ncbi:MAG TPA: molybdopterin cofactor-binding domain-containing protein [Candidatus Acidoferrum sp.]|jgi:isoquinoline 1-oxidoreductase